MSDSDTYAIVESGGNQYRAQKGSTLVVDRLPADEGAKVSLRAVMFCVIWPWGMAIAISMVILVAV